MRLGAEPYPKHQPVIRCREPERRGLDLGRGGSSWRENKSFNPEGKGWSVQHRSFHSSGSQRVALGPAASTSPGNMLEIKTASPHPRLTDSETRRMDGPHCSLR